jgi:hypothetical protein
VISLDITIAVIVAMLSTLELLKAPIPPTDTIPVMDPKVIIGTKFFGF